MAFLLLSSTLAVEVNGGNSVDHPIIRVKPPSGAGPFRPMWCAPSFNLDASSSTKCSREDVEGVDGAFVLHDVLSREEAAQMIEMSELMGFEDFAGRDGDLAGRSNKALSWCFHTSLAERLILRMAPLLPWGVAVHSPGTPTPTADQLPHVDGRLPWVRQVEGVPEGMYTLDGLNARMRVYRYDSESSDQFLPHYDETWPGTRLAFHVEGDETEATLMQDRWKYSDGSTPEATRAWSWSHPTDRVSHLSTHSLLEPESFFCSRKLRSARRASRHLLTRPPVDSSPETSQRTPAVLLYLNDDFDGGETVLFPGIHDRETPEEGSPRIVVTPRTGSALCFGQSFKFGRARVDHSADAILHEGVPVKTTGAGSGRKYVIRTDVCYTMPYRRE